MSDQTAVSPAGTKFLLRERKLLAAGRETLQADTTHGWSGGSQSCQLVLSSRPASLSTTYRLTEDFFFYSLFQKFLHLKHANVLGNSQHISITITRIAYIMEESDNGGWTIEIKQD